jgi:hypothetical protein
LLSSVLCSTFINYHFKHSDKKYASTAVKISKFSSHYTV